MARSKTVEPLHGLPVAIKDLEPAVGFPFTRGSPIYKEDMPLEDSLVVERLRRAGMILIGKTNVPEFGMGSHTYNPVYGTTLNPYDLTKSAGGSSGGAGAALAAGLLPLADGSDLGGSLRNPANFNNIVALRRILRSSPSGSVATSRVYGLRGAPTSAASHSIRGCARSFRPSARRSRISGALWRTPARI
jgi:Asp-tRNA(Asn)/Glu-tRNA(Gln) amidotransferase A subunit family amidase